MITYGNGEVIGLENIQGFDIRFKGNITIDPAQDNWIIQANKNRIIGICLNKTSSALLFTYTGELRILSAKYIRNNEQYRSSITLQGVDYWELDTEEWEDDGSLWGTRNGTYLIGTKKRKTTIKNLENGVSKVPIIHVGSKGFDAPYVPPPLVNTYSLDFDGSNDYVDIGDSDDLIVGTNVTISTWFKNSSGGMAYIFQSRRGASSSNLSLGINFDAGVNELAGYVGFVMYNGSGHTVTVTDENIDDGAWHHLAVTISDGAQKLYLDGSEVASSTAAFPNDASADHSLIGSNSGSNRFMNGNIDEVALWNVVLDADAITAIYNSGKPTNLSSDSGDYDNSSNLQGYWRMGDGTLDEYPLIADQTNATLGSDLLQKGNPIDDNGDWTAQTGWTADASNEKLTGSSTTGNIYATSTTSFSNGDILEVTFTVANYSSGSVRFIVGGNTNGTARSANGTYIEYVKVSSAVNTLIYIDGVLSFTGDIKGITVKKVQGNAGLMTNMVSGDIEEDTP